jgi:hypothetical protein
LRVLFTSRTGRARPDRTTAHESDPIGNQISTRAHVFGIRLGPPTIIVKPEPGLIAVGVGQGYEMSPNRTCERLFILFRWPVLRRQRQSQPKRCSAGFATVVHSRYPAATQPRQGPSCGILTGAQEREFRDAQFNEQLTPFRWRGIVAADGEEGFLSSPCDRAQAAWDVIILGSPGVPGEAIDPGRNLLQEHLMGS